MLSDQERGRVCVVLVRARNPNNIGAVARAMHDFGFSELRLVNEYPVALENAKSAVDASSILVDARAYDSVAQAIQDCTVVVGTTAVGKRRQEHPLRTLAEAGPVLRSALAKGRVALLFGSEKTGLSNEALSHCHWLLTIPMHETPGMRHASMNLGQAAAVCLYEFVRDTEANTDALSQSAPISQKSSVATAEELERLTDLWAQVLTNVGYAVHRPSAADPEEVRRTIRRLHLTQSDARRLTGMLRQILWKLGASSG